MNEKEYYQKWNICFSLQEQNWENIKVSAKMVKIA